MSSTTQDKIYELLKKNSLVRFRTLHIAKLLKANHSTIKNVLARMIKNKVSYKGFTREYKKQTSKTGREFICYVYFIK